MLGIGIGELILLLVLAFVVVGPEKLPHMARELAQTFRKIKQVAEDTRVEIEKDGS